MRSFYLLLIFLASIAVLVWYGLPPYTPLF
jgi:hypothetical protein